MKKDTPQNPQQAKGFLRWIEIAGNKLPHPFWMFVWICVFIVLTSAIASYLKVSVTDPQGELIAVKNLMSEEGLRWFLENMVTNFAHFAPLGLVLVMLMGVSIAEQSGLLEVIMRRLAFSTPKKIIFPVIFIIGACGNIGSDAGVVVVPPIAALIFMQLGYHPIAGLIAGYAGATAGFTANLFIAGTDVLLAGISTQITETMDPPMEVAATANWYFMIVSTLFLGIVGAIVVKRYTIPRAASFSGMEMVAGASEKSPELTPSERKGLKHAGYAFLAFVLVVIALTAPPGAPLRNPETGSLVVESPFLRGLIPILFVLFALPGYFYGRAVGTIQKFDDLIKHMEHGMRNLAGYIVLMLVVAQFIYMFTWSNLDTIIAVEGAQFLKTTGLTGPLLFILFMLLIAFLNIFMGSGSAKWAIFAPVFIPMLAQLGYSPAFVQLMYRVGDSVTNSISPLYVYFPLLLGWVHQYDKRLGIGTVISMLVPYALFLFVMWTVLLFVWFGFNLPIGVGEFIYLK